jgi:hypothetical protein
MLRNLFRPSRAGNPARVNHSFRPALETLELRDCPSATVVNAIGNFVTTQVQPVLNLAQQFEQEAVKDLIGAVTALNQGNIAQAVPLLQNFENELQVAAALDRIAEFEIQGLAQIDEALVEQGQEDALEHAFEVNPLIQQLQAQLQVAEVDADFINQAVHPNEDFDFVHVGHQPRPDLGDQGDNHGPGDMGDMNGQGGIPGPDHGPDRAR